MGEGGDFQAKNKGNTKNVGEKNAWRREYTDGEGRGGERDERGSILTPTSHHRIERVCKSRNRKKKKKASTFLIQAIEPSHRRTSVFLLKAEREVDASTRKRKEKIPVASFLLLRSLLTRVDKRCKVKPMQNSLLYCASRGWDN